MHVQVREVNTLQYNNRKLTGKGVLTFYKSKNYNISQ